MGTVELNTKAAPLRRSGDRVRREPFPGAGQQLGLHPSIRKRRGPQPLPTHKRPSSDRGRTLQSRRQHSAASQQLRRNPLPRKQRRPHHRSKHAPAAARVALLVFVRAQVGLILDLRRDSKGCDTRLLGARNKVRRGDPRGEARRDPRVRSRQQSRPARAIQVRSADCRRPPVTWKRRPGGAPLPSVSRREDGWPVAQLGATVAPDLRSWPRRRVT